LTEAQGIGCRQSVGAQTTAACFAITERDCAALGRGRRERFASGTPGVGDFMNSAVIASNAYSDYWGPSVCPSRTVPMQAHSSSAATSRSRCRQCERCGQGSVPHACRSPCNRARRGHHLSNLAPRRSSISGTGNNLCAVRAAVRGGKPSASELDSRHPTA
jgi:hypothetical protein